jgi:thioredoxin-related protein
MIRKILSIFIFIGGFATFSQTELKIYTFSELEKLQQQKPKPVAIFIYTDWCKICFGMKKTTFKNKKVIQLLNNNFYFVRLDGEEKKDIIFLDKTFVYKPTGSNTGVHELADELASINKRISYPTTTILNSKFEIELQINGLYNAKEMEKILSKLSLN